MLNFEQQILHKGCTSEGQVFHQREAASLNPTGKSRAKVRSPSRFPTTSV